MRNLGLQCVLASGNRRVLQSLDCAQIIKMFQSFSNSYVPVGSGHNGNSCSRQSCHIMTESVQQTSS